MTKAFTKCLSRAHYMVQQCIFHPLRAHKLIVSEEGNLRQKVVTYTLLIY